MSVKKLVAALVAFAGATAFTACLLALVDGMRDVAQNDGGYWSSAWRARRSVSRSAHR